MLFSLLKKLWRHVGVRRRKQLVLLLLLMIVASLSEIASIGAVLPFLGALMSPERIFANPLAQPLIVGLGLSEPRQILLPLTVAFIGAAMLSGLVRLLLLWAETRLGFAIGADFSIQIYTRTLYQPYVVHVARNSSEVIAGISGKTNSVVQHILLPLLVIASSILILVAILGVMFFIDPIVAICVFGGLGAIYVLIVLITKKRLLRDSERISHESTQVIKILHEGLGGIRDILIEGTQSAYCKIYQEADLRLCKSQANIQITSRAPRYGIETLGMVLITCLAYTLANNKDGISSAIPVLGALAICAQRLLPTLQQIYHSVTYVRGSQSSLKDVLNLLDQRLPAYAVEPAVAPIAFNESIRLKQISYRYGEDTPWVLKEVSLEIKKGSRVGLIGTTGSGKSTLIDVIMGLLYPNRGGIDIDGVPITFKNCRSWQAHIAHVPQSIFLADTTIAENIAFGIPPEKINYERLREAASQAQIDTTIESLEKKYETIVGEQGVRLSGGQRQRIGIARALYKQAHVIVFDEATSALDNETESAVMEAIDTISKDITIIIVAHRLTTLKGCDQIFELDNGHVHRSEKYKEIVQKGEKD